MDNERLHRQDGWMDIQDIENLFADLPIGGRIQYRASVDSTNSWAHQELHAGRTRNGDIFLSDQQTAGRGQNGRVWESKKSDGLWFSFVVLDSLPITPLPFLPCVAIQNYLAQDLGLDAHLKWPNDVLVGHRKIAGVLVESTASSQGCQGWIVGIGVNLGQTQFAGDLLNKATSVAIEKQTAPERNEALCAILGWLNAAVAGKEDLISSWLERSRMPGRSLTFTKNGDDITATILGLTAEGYLKIAHPDGRIETLISSSDLTLPQRY